MRAPYAAPHDPGLRRARRIGQRSTTRGWHPRRTAPFPRSRPMTVAATTLHPGLDPATRRDRAAARAAAIADDGQADLVLTGGAITTVDAARTTAEAIAIRYGRIAAVGPASTVQQLIGLRTRVVDLKGRSVVPGFGDSHIHALGAGVGMRQCDLREARGQDGYADVARRYAESHPDLPWIVGDGWYMADFPGGNP